MVKQRFSDVRKLIGAIVIVGFLIGLILALVSTNTPAQAAIGACSSPEDCLSKMTLDEKIGQMTQANHSALDSPSDITTYYLGSLLSGGGEGPYGSGGTASQWADMYDNYQSYAVATRLGIPLIYGVDAVHGHNNVQGAVIFPHHIGMGATRNTALVEQAEAVTRDEVLGTGMNWVFAPCVAVPQNDRWGRTYEGYGEDPALVSAMGAASIRGFQGSGLGTNTVLATAKHYVGDGGTTNGIDQGDTQVSEEVLRAIHLPPYQSAVANDVGSVMISFNSWNGEKLHGHDYLITTVLKGELGFDGIVVSDWAGIDQLPGDYASDVRTAINAGIDMVMVPSDYKTFISTLKTEVNAGRIPMSRIDNAVLRILNQKFALGLFTKYQTDRTYTSQVGSAAHRAVARQAVRESLVLLKNDGVLPLSKTDTYRIVVGGSHVDNLGYQLGGWSISWQGESGDTTTGTTFWEALQAAKPPNVTLQNVGINTGGSFSGDIGITVIGETPYAEGEGDSYTLAVSSANTQQVSDICSKTTRCIVILMSGRPLIINNQLNQADAFVAAWLPGTEGAGMTDVLFGDYNFTGKLPVTWPNAVSQEPINDGDGKVGLFPFGYGLSYGATPTSTPVLTPTSTTLPPTTPPPTTLPPTTPPPSSTYQAEDASLGGGVSVDTNHSGYYGTGFVNFPTSGGYVEYRNVDGGSGGSRTLQFRFALGATSARTGQLTINGATQNITFQPTGSWDSWSTMDVTAALNAGTSNTIRLQSTGQDLANQDQVEVIGGITPPTATPVTIVPPTSTPVTVIPPTSTPVTIVPPTSTPTTAPPTNIPGICSVDYVIQNDWGSGATVSVTVRNNGTSIINGWTITWTFPGNQQITNLWNGSYSQSGASVSVSNANWNATIGANGGTTSFGFNLVYSGTNAVPPNFTLNGTHCQ
ncbi:MAG: glycoside hydrolase family 3 C-terminal domain-containing protein [Anaerolineae bacterium]|nr:glycoside hydrolase family 3 C-terminal domain-containing protein [Anaerolineae bacterium]